jgi:hypothetical protein
MVCIDENGFPVAGINKKKHRQTIKQLESDLRDSIRYLDNRINRQRNLIIVLVVLFIGIIIAKCF